MEQLGGQTSFEVEQEPAITEVEVCVVAILPHVIKQLRVQDLQQTRRARCDIISYQGFV